MLVLGLPLLDGLWVTLYRLINGRSPLHADMGHLHHRLLKAGYTQPQIVLAISGVSAVFGALALLLPNREWKLVGFVAIGILLVGILAILARKTAQKDLHEKAPGV
jgi:hypothetical protein